MGILQKIAKCFGFGRKTSGEMSAEKVRELVNAIQIPKSQHEVDFDTTDLDIGVGSCKAGGVLFEDKVSIDRLRMLREVQSKPSFVTRLRQLINEKYDGEASKCYKAAGISRQAYSKIISNPQSTVSRRTALQFCIGLKLSLAEANELLEKAGYVLRETSLEEMIFKRFIEEKCFDIIRVSEALVSCDCEPLKLTF